MPGLKSTFAKIVGSPTDTAWSQAYSAGDLYAIISLAKHDDSEELSLNVVGKGILNNIEAEFYSLEDKTLASIKAALTHALTSTPESIHVHLALCFLKENAAYLFVIGDTRILLKRQDRTGAILTGTETKKDPRAIHASSGLLKDSDILMLETSGFTKHISETDVTKALASPTLTEAEEALMPHIHAKEAGDAASLFIKLHSAGDITPEETPLEEPEEPIRHAPEHPNELPLHHAREEQEEGKNTPIHSPKEINHQELESPLHAAEDNTQVETPREKGPSLLEKVIVLLPRLRGKRMLILVVAIILAVVLVGSIYTVNSNREQAKTSAAFQEVYGEALKEYDLGITLEELNKNVALDNFRKAQTILNEKKDIFREGTEERKQIDELLSKITAKLGGQDTGKSVEAKTVADTESPLLALQLIEKTPFVTSVDNEYYFVTKDAVIKTDATGDDKEELYENDDDWSDVAGIGAFGSNVYVLDRKSGVLKLVAGADGYGKQSYFTGENPNLTQAADMAIDGSVWILLKDGAILKYTKGEKEAFSVSALQKPFSSPLKIITSVESDNLYILDRGNSRVVVLDKSGTFKTAYSAEVIKKATGIDVSEGDRRLYVLSVDKVYEIAL